MVVKVINECLSISFRFYTLFAGMNCLFRLVRNCTTIPTIAKTTIVMSSAMTLLLTMPSTSIFRVTRIDLTVWAKPNLEKTEEKKAEENL